MSPVDPINPEIPTEVEYKAMPRRFGWRPDLPDRRDRYRLAPPRTGGLPERVDLTPLMPPIWEQGNLGSCVAQCMAASMMYLQRKQGFPVWQPSRLFLYYNARHLEGTELEDAGSSIRSGVRAANKWGACYEVLWPYQIDRFNAHPPAGCYEIGENHQALRYERVGQTTAELRHCLADGWPIVFGLAVYPSFSTFQVAQTGIVPTPGVDVEAEGEVEGHAMVLVGYDAPRDRYLARNHWSALWGQAGHCWLAGEYLRHPGLAGDLWCLTALE